MVQGSAQSRLNAALRTRTTMDAKTLNLKVGDAVDFYRSPVRKEDTGWFGPATVVDVSQSSRDIFSVRFATRTYQVSSSCIRRHLVFFVFLVSPRLSSTPTRAWNEFRNLVQSCRPRILHHVGSSYQKNTYHRTREDKAQPSIFPRLRTWASDQLGLDNVSAVRYGRSIKSYNQIKGFCQSIVIAWNTEDQVYRIIDVQSHADQAENQMQTHKVNVDRILNESWEDTCSIQFLLIPETMSLRVKRDSEDHGVEDNGSFRS